jgi:hypothetical protein
VQGWRVDGGGLWVQGAVGGALTPNVCRLAMADSSQLNVSK